ncbi:MAG TPA: YMGG-like glycine zipper-containing protein [Cellvibrio sp.]|nr:YMGG-like glycine zipper-containing protein [Cellvibrio sp.]
MHSSFTLIAVTALITFAGSASAQAPTTKSLSGSLGVMAFPAKGQTAEKQSQDEKECFNWSKTQTGYDPANPSASTSTQVASAPEQHGGQRLRGAARGAAAGAIIGEVADDDSRKGAEIGAAAGVLKGGAEKRRQKADAEQHAAQQQQQLVQEQASLFNKGFGTCLEAKGYTVK